MKGEVGSRRLAQKSRRSEWVLLRSLERHLHPQETSFLRISEWHGHACCSTAIYNRLTLAWIPKRKDGRP